MVIDAWSRYFVELLSRPVCQLTISLHALLGMTLHVVGPRRDTEIFRVWKFLRSHRGNSGFKHGSVIVNNVFAYFRLSLSTSQENMIKERCWFSQIDFFIQYFLHRIKIFLFPANLMSSTYTDKSNPLSRCTNKHSQLETFSQTCFNRIFSNCLSHNSPAKG